MTEALDAVHARLRKVGLKSVREKLAVAALVVLFLKPLRLFGPRLVAYAVYVIPVKDDAAVGALKFKTLSLKSSLIVLSSLVEMHQSTTRSRTESPSRRPEAQSSSQSQDARRRRSHNGRA